MYKRVVGKGPSVTRIRRIMHPSDFSPTSARAFVKAIQFAHLNRARLLLVYVLAPIAPIIGDDYVASSRMYVDLQRAARAHGKEEIDKLVAKAKKAGVRTSGLLLEGNPAQQIVRAAKSTRTDMIVMGTHGRTGLAKLFIGSVAQRVVSTAPCPVLTIRSR
jgi:nucleotide-binding universal stress UspA family protein